MVEAGSAHEAELEATDFIFYHVGIEFSEGVGQVDPVFGVYL